MFQGQPKSENQDKTQNFDQIGDEFDTFKDSAGNENCIQRQDLVKVQLEKNDSIIKLSCFHDDDDLNLIMQLVEQDLSEPYSIYTFRFFIYNFPTLTIVAKQDGILHGVVVGRIDVKKNIKRGYIAMLVVNKSLRKQGLGSKLLNMQLEEFIKLGCDEVILETEKANTAAIKLYESFGFQREKFLEKYYLNAGDAYRLKLFLSFNKARFTP